MLDLQAVCLKILDSPGRNLRGFSSPWEKSLMNTWLSPLWTPGYVEVPPTKIHGSRHQLRWRSSCLIVVHYKPAISSNSRKSAIPKTPILYRSTIYIYLGGPRHSASLPRWPCPHVGSSLTRSRSATSFWTTTVSLKESTALHSASESLLSIADKTASRVRLRPMRVIRILRCWAHGNEHNGNSFPSFRGQFFTDNHLYDTLLRACPEIICVSLRVSLSPRGCFDDRQDC